jgi:hypothetical protein
MRKQFSIASLVCLPLIACGGSDNNNTKVKVPDSGKAIDAPVMCTAPAMYTLGTKGGAFDTPEHMDGSGSGTIVHSQDIQLQVNVSTDLLRFLLNAQFGSFGSGDIVPGTYALAGDDLDSSACGICAFVYPQVFDGSGALVTGYDFNDNLYMATAGTLVITADTAPAGSGSSGTFTGSLSNMTFKHVNFSGASQTYAADGCMTAIATGGPFTLPLKYQAPSLKAGDELPVPEAVLRHRAL